MKKILAFTLTLLVFQVAFAQDTDSTKKTSLAPVITGSVDVYYRYNFNDPKSKYNKKQSAGSYKHAKYYIWLVPPQCYYCAEYSFVT